MKPAAQIEESSLTTRTSLLERLRDLEDQASWQRFFNQYARLIRGVGLKAGLSEWEADEVLQETIISVAKHLPGFRYDPQVCAFKTWMLRLTRWRILNQLRRRTPGNSVPLPLEGIGEVELDGLAAAQVPELTKIWNAEWEQAVLPLALEKVKQRVNPDQFQIFDLHALRGMPVSEVASVLGIHAAAVYLAKHRVAAALKQEIAALETAGW